jgi:hypothetical protein
MFLWVKIVMNYSCSSPVRPLVAGTEYPDSVVWTVPGTHPFILAVEHAAAMSCMGVLLRQAYLASQTQKCT